MTIDAKHFNEKWSDQTVYNLAADREAGLTIKQLAKKYKMTDSQVKYVLYKRVKNENKIRGLPIDNVALREVKAKQEAPKSKKAPVDKPIKTKSTTVTVSAVGVTAVAAEPKINPTVTVDQPPEAPKLGLWARLWRTLFG